MNFKKFESIAFYNKQLVFYVLIKQNKEHHWEQLKSKFITPTFNWSEIDLLQSLSFTDRIVLK